MKKIHCLTIEDWCSLLGVTENEMPCECKKIICEKDFRYTYFSETERDKIVVDFLHRMDQGAFTLSGENHTARWEKGWGEVLDNFKKSGDKKTLIPPYNRNGKPIRLFGNYAKSMDDNFENNFIELLRNFIFQKYFRDKDSIYEFGCGSSYNLVAFAEMDPAKYYFGSDWVPQPIQIIEAVAKKFGHNIEGAVFDMFRPDFEMPIRDNSAMFTFGSSEQLGKAYGNFLQFLLDKPFGIYVHVGSILEMYDVEHNLTDYLTYRFEQQRNYCDGFFTALRELEADGTIQLLKMHRVQCGGFLGDGYSLTVWKKS